MTHRCLLDAVTSLLEKTRHDLTRRYSELCPLSLECLVGGTAELALGQPRSDRGRDILGGTKRTRVYDQRRHRPFELDLRVGESKDGDLLRLEELAVRQDRQFLVDPDR